MVPSDSNAGKQVRQVLDSTRVQTLARQFIGSWVDIEVHPYGPLYCWHDTPIFNDFGEPTGRMRANTIYLCDHSPCPVDDLFHEIGHAVARRFDLIGHRENGYRGCWEQRQRRLVGCVGAGRHWSRLLDRVRRSSPPYTRCLASEIWAELFMCWYCYPDREETALIALEMFRLGRSPEILSSKALAGRLYECWRVPRLPC